MNDLTKVIARIMVYIIFFTLDFLLATGIVWVACWLVGYEFTWTVAFIYWAIYVVTIYTIKGLRR